MIEDVDMSWMNMEPEPSPKLKRTYPRALILEPTRELAIQVKKHLQMAAKYTDIKVCYIYLTVVWFVLII